jgi:DNA-binding CsgD family transcriptional regulator
VSAPASRLAKARVLDRLAECDTWCQRAEALARAHGDWGALLRLWRVRGQRSLAEGRPADACALFEQAEALTLRLGLGEPCLVPWARDAAAAYAACGRADDARRVVSWLERCVARLPCRWPRIAAAVGRACLAEQAGDAAEAEHQFRVALALHAQAELPLEHVQTLLQYGALVRRRGQPARARALLREALERAEAAGAGWLGRRARAELTVAGGRRRRRSCAVERLTAQEQRVAALAGEGRSNAEIADQLVLSINTVQTHLQHIYAKYGIRSRRELMRVASPRVH